MTSRRPRPSLAAAGAAVLALAAAPGAAHAGPVFPTANDDPSALGINSAPRVGPSIGGVPAGASVEVLCQVAGQTLSDPKYGRTALWDRISYRGVVGYVTDLYVLTNVDRIAGVPDCNAAPAPAPAPPAPAPPAPAPAPAPPSAPAPAPGYAPAATGGAITRAEVLDRAQGWINRKIMYSQVRFTDGYRQDCSGFVAMAWKLPSSPNSATLATSRWTTTIAKADLRPGDMLRIPGHVALFLRWASGGRAVVREEYDDGHPAVERTWTAAYTRRFTAHRYKSIR